MFSEKYSQTDEQTKFALQTHDKISTKFALQTRQDYRQIYRQNSHDEEVDKVQPVNTMQLSMKLSSKFALQMQRYR